MGGINGIKTPYNHVKTEISASKSMFHSFQAFLWSMDHIQKMTFQCNYSQISVIQMSIIRNYWVIRRRWTVPTFFPIIYCNKTTYYSNFDYPKNSILQSDSSVRIKENAIKLPFKIRSPNVKHGDHDFFVWSSSINTPE